MNLWKRIYVSQNVLNWIVRYVRSVITLFNQYLYMYTITCGKINDTLSDD